MRTDKYMRRKARTLANCADYVVLDDERASGPQSSILHTLVYPSCQRLHKDEDDPFDGDHAVVDGAELLERVCYYTVYLFLLEHGLDPKKVEVFTDKLSNRDTERLAVQIVYRRHEVEKELPLLVAELMLPQQGFDYRPQESIPEDHYA